jgi:hypothetical protein
MDAPHENLTADRPAAGRLRPRRALCLPSLRQSGCRTQSARHVGSDMGHPLAALWAALGQAAFGRRWAALATHTVLNRNHFLFI